MPQRYEREIEEILRRMGVASLDRTDHRRAIRRFWDWLVGGLSRIGALLQPSRLMIAGTALALLSYLLGRMALGMATWLAVLSVVAFVGAIALSVIRDSGRRRYRSGWRGRTLDLEREGSLWEGWMRRWREWRRGKWGPRL